MSFLDFLKETSYQAIGTTQKAIAEQKAQSYLAESELEAAGRQARRQPAPAEQFKPFSIAGGMPPIPTTQTINPTPQFDMGQLELEAAGRQGPTSTPYPMQGTSSWISGPVAAARLGIPYDPNALYERPWDPSGPGVPLEILYNQLIRDEISRNQTSVNVEQGELDSAGQQPARQFSPIPYGPGAQQALGGIPFQPPPRPFESTPGQRVISEDDYINSLPIAMRPRAAEMRGIGTGGTLGALSRLARPFDAATETTFDIMNSGALPGVGQMSNIGITASRAGLDALQGRSGGEILDRAASGFVGRNAGGNLQNNIVEARGNPIGVMNRQADDYYARPVGEQVAIGLGYDPTNAIPLGAIGNIAQGATTVARGVAGVPLSALARGAGKVAGAIDQSLPEGVRGGLRALSGEAGGGELAPLVKAAFDSPVAKKIGARPDIGFRTAASVTGATAGAMEGDSIEERVRNAAIGAGAGFVAPELTRAASKAPALPAIGAGIGAWTQVGEDPSDILKGTGAGFGVGLAGVGATKAVGAVGRKTPAAVMRSGESSTPYLHLPEFDTLPTDLTRGERVGGRIDDILAKVTGDRTGELLSASVRKDPRLSAIVDITNYNRQHFGRIAEYYTKEVDNVLKQAGVEFDDAGAVIIGGNRIPAYDPIKMQWLTDDAGNVITGAIGADVRQALKADPNVYDSILSPEQIDAFMTVDGLVDDMRDLLTRMGEPTAWIDGYLPRGRLAELDAQDAISAGPLNTGMGREPGSLKPREYKTGASAIASGERGYPAMPEAIGNYVRETLDRVNSRWASNMIEQIDIDGTPIGASRNLAAKRELDALRTEARPLRAEQRKLEVRINRTAAQLNATDRSIASNAKKIDTLMSRIGVPGQRTGAIRESIGIVEQTLQGVRYQADEAMRLIAKSTGQGDAAAARVSESYQAARAAIADIKKLSTDVEEYGDLAKTLSSDATGEFDATVSKRITKAWQDAMKLRNDAVNEIARLERQIGRRDEFVREAAKAKLAVGEFKAKYGRMSKNLGEGITGMRARALELANSARTETKLSALGTEGTQASTRKLRLQEQSKELKKKIDDISSILTPKQDRIAELKVDLEVARSIAKSRAKWATMDKLLPLKGVPVPKDFADYFNARWVENAPAMTKVHRTGAVYDFFNNVWRGLGATLDLATYGTVQLASAADNPARAVRTFRDGLKSMRNEGHYWERLMEINEYAKANDLPPLHVLLSRGFELATPETMISRADPGLAGKIANKSGPKIGSRQLFGPKEANIFFDTTTNLTRVLDAYDNLDALRIAGRDPWATDSIVEATTASMINTGRAKGGIPGLSDTASGRLLFAGRFTRSQVEMGMNALVSGAIEGQGARRAFMRLAGLAAASAYVLNDAVGEEWDPENPFKVKMFGYNVDLAGPWGTLLRRATEFANEASSGDGMDALGVLGAYAQTKAAPMPNLALRMAGVDIGSYEVPNIFQALEEKDIPYFINFLPAPFSIRDMAETGLETDWTDPGDIGKLLFGAGINFVGIKNNLLSPGQKYADDKNDAYEDYEPTFYTKDDSWEAKDDPLFDYIYSKDNPNAKPEPTTSLGRALQDEREWWAETSDGLEDKLLDMSTDVDDWRDEVAEKSAVYRDRVARLVEETEFADPKEGTPAWWVKTYFDTFAAASDEGGVIDSDKLAALQGEWAAQNGEEARLYVHELTKANDTPIYQAYQDAMYTLSQGGYFDRTKLPKYIGVTTDQDELSGYISDIQSFATAAEGDEKYGGMPKAIKDKPFVYEAAWYMENILKSQDPALLTDMLNAYKANETISTLKSGKAPKRGTLAWEGLQYVEPEFVKFSIEHKNELLWFSEHKNITAVAPYLDAWLQENLGIPLSEYKQKP